MFACGTSNKTASKRQKQKAGRGEFKNCRQIIPSPARHFLLFTFYFLPAPDIPHNCLLLLPETKTPDYRPVALDVLLLHIIEKPASLADQLEQSPTGMMILLVRLEMLRQVLDPGAQQGYLNLRRAGILLVQLVIVYNVFSFACI
jgi:hypothetical protein